MIKNDSHSGAANLDLVRILTALKEINASINQLGVDKDLQTILKLIATGAVKAVAAGNSAAGTQSAISSVIWIYDAARRAFDARSRVSAGEPPGASIDDFPRPNGIGMQAIRCRTRLLSHQLQSTAIHPAKRQAGALIMVCYPLLANDIPVGALYLYRTNEQRFSEIELLLLDNFVQMAATAIYYGRQMGGLSQALDRKVHEMEKLRRASQLISSRTNLDETLQEILLIGLEITAAQYGSFELYDKKQNRLVTRALAGSGGADASPPLPLDDRSVVGRAALHRRSLRIADLSDPAWRDIYQPLPIGREMRSELAVPIIGASGGLEGVLNIESPQTNAFSVGDQQLLETLATQAVVAIQEIRLLDAMQDIVQVLLTPNYDDLLKLVVERACELINVTSGSIWIVSEPDTLALHYATDTERLGEQIPLRGSLTGQAIRLRQPVPIDDVRQRPEFTNPELAQKKGWVSAIVVPLLASADEADPVGSFSLYSTHLRDFSDWDKKLLTCLANHAAVAIRDAERLRQLKQAQERQAAAETIAAMGDVAANLLHQLNNKLGAISARVQGIEAKCVPALESWPYLENNLQEIATTTRQAMAVVRDSMAPLQLERSQPVAVSGCLTKALKRAAPPPTVSITCTDVDTLPRVLAGHKQLEMIFYNLIDNAVKAMDNRGRLHIVGNRRDNFVTVSVIDSGPGIPKEQQGRIFDFSSALNNQEQQAGRLSFGLWWVKTFVDRFGGRVELKSEPEQGSRFTVWLPAERVK